MILCICPFLRNFFLCPLFLLAVYEIFFFISCCVDVVEELHRVAFRFVCLFLCYDCVKIICVQASL